MLFMFMQRGIYEAEAKTQGRGGMPAESGTQTYV